jgi:hypothetical protein
LIELPFEASVADAVRLELDGDLLSASDHCRERICAVGR